MGLIDAREYYINKCKKTPSITNTRQRREAIKAVNDMKRKLQQEYIEEAIESGKGNSKETWKRLKQVWPLKNKSTKIIELNGKNDPAEMAEEMNTYFANIGEELENNINPVSWDPPKNNFAPTFRFNEVAVGRVQELINGLN